jgi:hypothetical protein
MKTTFHNHLVAVLVLCLAGTTAFSKDQIPETDYKQVGKKFVSAKFSASRESFLKALAPEVLLLGGHEYLKKEYGISQTGDRMKSVAVKRDTLADLDAKVYSQFPKKKMEKIKELLAQADYRFVISKQNGMTLDPWTQEETGKRTRSLPTKKGDVVMVVLPEPKGDYLLYVMRKIDGTWRVVMDYTD